jgi:type IV pilus assembly protein PilV
MNAKQSRVLPRRHSGFTMLEVLISIVVIAFGLLGVAGLQAFALKNSQSASFRSVATVLATDLIDRMRANPVGATGNSYANGANEGTATEVAACLQAAGCPTPQDLAANDLFEWHALISRSLPRGVGIVCRDSSPNDGDPPPADTKCDGTGALVVKIWWSDERNVKPDSANAAKAFRFSTEFQI